MSARTTRVLVLGTIRRLQSATGYEVQSSLFAMAADRWAGLRSGSIYAMLRTLAREGFTQTEPREPARHILTEIGRDEHDKLLLSALRSLPETGDTTELRAALHFADLLPADLAFGALRERLSEIARVLSDIDTRLGGADAAKHAPFVTHGSGLAHALLRAQSDWLRNLINEASD